MRILSFYQIPLVRDAPEQKIEMLNTAFSSIMPEFIAFGDYNFYTDHLCEMIIEYAQDAALENYHLFSFSKEAMKNIEDRKLKESVLRIYRLNGDCPGIMRVEEDLNNHPPFKDRDKVIVNVILAPNNIKIGNYRIDHKDFNYFIDEMFLSVNSKTVQETKQIVDGSHNPFFQYSR